MEPPYHLDFKNRLATDLFDIVSVKSCLNIRPQTQIIAWSSFQHDRSGTRFFKEEFPHLPLLSLPGQKEYVTSVLYLCWCNVIRSVPDTT